MPHFFKTGGGWVLNLIGHNTDKRGKVKMDVTPYLWRKIQIVERDNISWRIERPCHCTPKLKI